MERYELSFATRGEMEAALADSLLKGRAFLAGYAAVAERQTCELLICVANHEPELRLRAELVFSQSETEPLGIGLSFTDPDYRERLLTYFEELAPQESRELDALELLPADEGANREPSDDTHVELGDGATQEANESTSQELGDGASAIHSLLERIRKLSRGERDRMARSGTQQERILLERAFGSAVWEALLSHPQISAPEVAKIARNGTCPLPLLMLIVQNPGWLGKGEIRRALLQNTKLSMTAAQKVLRASPQAELKLAPNQTAYPARIRMLAKDMLGTK